MKVKDEYKGYADIYQPSKTPKELMEDWYFFMEKNIPLRTLCIRDYEEEGIDWKQIAIEKVFSLTHNHFHTMEKAHQLLLGLIPNLEDALSTIFSMMDIDLEIILYHGLGNAAGWAEQIDETYYILLGIEKIVELGWDTTSKLQDLIVHECAHIVHEITRGSSLTPESLLFADQWIFHLYVEGFATYCEDMMNGRMKSSKDWYEKCVASEKELKKLFSQMLFDEDVQIQRFFGDWDKVLNLNEAGYFLGYRVIQEMMKEFSFTEIMRLGLNYIREYVNQYLR